MRRFVFLAMVFASVSSFAPPPGVPGLGLGGDEDAFLSAVFDVPPDDLPRLVFADWLDETGHLNAAQRAEYIRIETERAQLEGQYGRLALSRVGLAPRPEKDRYRQLTARSRELAARGANAPARLDDAQLATLLERRGWVDEVTFNISPYLGGERITEYLADFCRRYPIRKVTFRFPDPAWLTSSLGGRPEYGRTVWGSMPMLPENCRVDWLNFENVSLSRFQDYFCYSYEAGVRPGRITAQINRTSMTRPRSLYRQTFQFEYDYEPMQMHFISRWLFGMSPGDRYATRRELPRWAGNEHLSFDAYWRHVGAQGIAGLQIERKGATRIDLRFNHRILRGADPVPRERCGPALVTAGS